MQKSSLQFALLALGIYFSGKIRTCTCNSVFATKKFKPKFTKKPTRGTKLNELDKKRTGTSQMSKRFGPHFAPGSFALQQCIRLVYTLRALSRDRNRATRATGVNQDAHTQKEHTHARQRRHNTTTSPRLRRGAGRCCCRAAATAAAAAGAAGAAAVLLLCCCCAAAASRPAMDRGAQPRLNRLFLVLCFMGRTQERVTAQQQ